MKFWFFQYPTTFCIVWEVRTCQRDGKSAVDVYVPIVVMLNRDSYPIYVCQKYCSDSLFELFKKCKEEYFNIDVCVCVCLFLFTVKASPDWTKQ